MRNIKVKERIDYAAKRRLDWLNLVNLELTSEQLASELRALGPSLTELRSLELDGNQLTELPKEIGSLINLRTLSITNNQLCRLPAEIGRLVKLQVLSASGNRLREFPVEICELVELRELRLDSNELRRLPQDFERLRKLTVLSLSGNSMIAPEEILADEKNPDKILNYYFQSLKGRPINEAKLIVIGESGVGKTSLIKRLLYDTFDSREDTTHGIEIYQWKDLEVNNQKVQLNIWDFGGQELMHATHQFFFTNRTLYLLVVNARENQNEQRAEYWLTKIRGLAKRSPVMVIGNKLDQARSPDHARGKFQIDEYALRGKYDNIKGFWAICCDKRRSEYDSDFARFKDALIVNLALLDGIHALFPKDWFEMKDHLATMPEDFISYDEYIRRCEARGITKKLDQETLIEFLHDLGIVLSFRKDQRLQDTQVRNPKWVTKGVYAIVESQLVRANNGVLEIEMLKDILDNTAYPPHKHLYIVDMMRRFQLCYDIVPDKKFLIPGSLPLQQPLIEKWKDTLNFQYKYETYFGSIISRFMVKMNTRIDGRAVWLHGAVLKYRDNKALVKADIHEKTISISIKGNKSTCREFLSMIRERFDTIHEDFDMRIEERVPIPGHDGFFEDYQHLLTLESMGKDDIVPRGLNKVFSVTKLLNNVESENEREERRKKEGGRRKNRTRSLKVFAGETEGYDVKQLAPLRIKELPAKIEATIEVRQRQIAELKQKKSLCDDEARFRPRLYAFVFFSVVLLIIGLVFYFVTSYPSVRTFVSAFSIILLVTGYLWSAITLKEWSPAKFPEQLFEKEKRRLYDKFGFDEQELTALSEELAGLRIEQVDHARSMIDSQPDLSTHSSYDSNRHYPK